VFFEIISSDLVAGRLVNTTLTVSQIRSMDDVEMDSQGGDDARESGETHRASKRAIKSFSIALIGHAKDSNWEDHEIARLVLLIARERQLTPKKTIKFLASCSICNPVVLSRLGDEGLSFDASQIIIAMYDQARHIDGFIEVINESLEEGILSVKDDETIQALFEIANTSMDTQQQKRFAFKICDHSETKHVCGKILNTFASQFQTAEAAGFVCDVIGYDFFLDLKGSMKGFLAAMPAIADRVQMLVADTRSLDERGNIVDSDADEKGNLKGFVEDDMSDDPYQYVDEGEDVESGEEDRNCFDEEAFEGEEEEEEEDEEEDDSEDGDEDGDEDGGDDDDMARLLNARKHAQKGSSSSSHGNGSSHRHGSSSSSSSSSRQKGSSSSSSSRGGGKLRRAGDVGVRARRVAEDEDDELDWLESPVRSAAGAGTGAGGGGGGGRSGGNGSDADDGDDDADDDDDDDAAGQRNSKRIRDIFGDDDDDDDDDTAGRKKKKRSGRDGEDDKGKGEGEGEGAGAGAGAGAVQPSAESRSLTSASVTASRAGGGGGGGGGRGGVANKRIIQDSDDDNE
jgi:hypothetical protein